MAQLTVLLVSRENELTSRIQSAVSRLGNLQLRVVTHIGEAYSLLRSISVGVVFAHLGRRRQDLDDLVEFLDVLGVVGKRIPVVVISDRDDPDAGLLLLEKGAKEYLERPLNLNRIRYLADVFTVARHERQELATRPEIFSFGPEDDPFVLLPGTQIESIMQKVRCVAPTDSTVLLTGETGTGKTRLAKVIHSLSNRSQNTFLTLNCASVAPQLIESDIFGHKKGAFTGANADRIGKFAAVGQGTLLLDEIDTLPLELQAKLLQIVDERIFTQVGSNHPVPFLGRLIVASNRSLAAEVEAGRFRKDLYYRLEVVQFKLPSLRSQKQAISKLADFFVLKFAEKYNKPVVGVSTAAKAILNDFDWPGNIRELQHAIEHAVTFCNGPLLLPEHLPDRLQPQQVVPQPECILDETASQLLKTKGEAEAALIWQTLQRNDFNRVQTARELGISRACLYSKLNRYGLLELCQAAAAMMSAGVINPT